MSEADSLEHSSRQGDQQESAEHVRPLKPRPKLFVALLVVFALWVALLVFLKLAATSEAPQASEAPAENQDN